jgi:hypothetical protein
MQNNKGSGTRNGGEQKGVDGEGVMKREMKIEK